MADDAAFICPTRAVKEKIMYRLHLLLCIVTIVITTTNVAAAPNGLCAEPGNYGQFAYKHLDITLELNPSARGKKPAWPATNCVDDLFNSELAHEHFIKCHDGEVVGGFGLAPEGPFDNSRQRQNEYFPKDSTKYDISIMDEVIKEVMGSGMTSATPRSDGGIQYVPENKTPETTYNFTGHQCQNFAEELRKKYNDKKSVRENAARAGSYTKCADEHGFCKFTGKRQVRYGKNGKYAYQIHENGVSCSNNVFGDPNYGVLKECFKLEELVDKGEQEHLSTIDIKSNHGNKINVLSATYGKNCGVSPGNVTLHLASSCNGKTSCSYSVNHKVIGDPAYGCRKTYEATYKCSNSVEPKQVFVAPEAGYGSIAALTCNP